MRNNFTHKSHLISLFPFFDSFLNMQSYASFLLIVSYWTLKGREIK